MDSIRLVGSVAALAVIGLLALRRMRSNAELASGMSERRSSFVVAKPADETYQRAKTFDNTVVVLSSSDDALRQLTFQSGNFAFPVMIRSEGKASMVDVGCVRPDGKFAPLDALHQTFVDALRDYLKPN